MSYNRQTDANQPPILKALKGVTFAMTVHRTGELGFDILARHVVTKAPVFIEVKNPQKDAAHRALNDNEKAMQGRFPDQYRVVMTVDEALRAVGIEWSARTATATVEFQPADLSPLARRTKRRGSL